MADRDPYKLEDHLMPIISGKTEAPNWEDVPLEKAVANIASSLPPGIRGNVRRPGQQYTNWAQFFLQSGQGGQLYGSGLVIYYDKGVGRAGKFEICKHQYVAEATSNPQRGLNDGHCGKCGLDMSIDSSD